MIIIKPTDPIQSTILKMLIIGEPGIGKTTLACSTEKPILFDFDLGADRTGYRKAATIAYPQNYAELLSFVQSPDFRQFSTAIFDTAGALVERIIFDHVKATPTYFDFAAGMPNQKGWGVAKNLFSQLFNAMQVAGVDIIFVAHEKRVAAKKGDVEKSTPAIVGSAAQIILQACQQVGFMYAEGNRRVLDFSVDQTHTSKDSAGVGKVYVESMDTHPDQFKALIATTKTRILENANRFSESGLEILELRDLIKKIENPLDADMVLDRILEFNGSAQGALKMEIFKRTGSLGINYNKETKGFEDAKAA